MTQKKKNIKKIQIHPSITPIAQERLKRYDVKASEALEEYSEGLELGNKDLNAKLTVLYAKKEFYQTTYNNIKLLLDQATAEIKELEAERDKALAKKSDDLKEAKDILNIKFNNILTELDSPDMHFGIKKVSIKFVKELATAYNTTITDLLAGYDKKTLKKVLENYDKYV